MVARPPAVNKTRTAETQSNGLVRVLNAASDEHTKNSSKTIAPDQSARNQSTAHHGAERSAISGPGLYITDRDGGLFVYTATPKKFHCWWRVDKNIGDNSSPVRPTHDRKPERRDPLCDCCPVLRPACTRRTAVIRRWRFRQLRVVPQTRSTVASQRSHPASHMGRIQQTIQRPYVAARRAPANEHPETGHLLGGEPADGRGRGTGDVDRCALIGERTQTRVSFHGIRTFVCRIGRHDAEPWFLFTPRGVCSHKKIQSYHTTVS